MEPVVFVHAADLHLDSPFIGLSQTSVLIAQRLNRATFEAFDRVIELCLKEKVDFLVVAGDIYDGDDRSLRAQFHFRDGLSRLAKAGIQSFVVHGNHDPLNSWAASVSFPPEVKIFGEKLESEPVFRDGRLIARVLGMSYPTRNVVENLAPHYHVDNPDNIFTVGLLHANVGGNANHGSYAPCTLADLLAAKVDYFALGHIHQHVTLNETPSIVYAGNTQGRSIRETGPRGCILVRAMSRDDIEHRFVETDTVRWFREEVAIDDVDDHVELRKRLDACLEESLKAAGGRSTVVCIRLTGRTFLHKELSRPDILVSLRDTLREDYVQRVPFAWLSRIERCTSPLADLAIRAQGDDLLAIALRLVESLKTPEGKPGVMEAVGDLFGHSRISQHLDALNDEDLHAILDQAGLICHGLLEGEE